MMSVDELIDSNLKRCESVMFFPENLEKMSKNIVNASREKKVNNLQPKTKTPSKVPEKDLQTRNDFFIPYQKDKLFWSFFIILYGMEKYEQAVSHSFSVEKKLKIESIETMGQLQMAQKIKELKVKRIDVETELLSNNDVSLKCVYALCAIHSISLIIIVGEKYYMFDFDSSKLTNNTGIISRQSSGEFAVYTANSKTSNSIIDSLYRVENVCKPIKPMSSYLVTELKKLCIKMNIPLEDSSNGKYKTKNKLYEDVLLFMNS